MFFVRESYMYFEIVGEHRGSARDDFKGILAAIKISKFISTSSHRDQIKCVFISKKFSANS